MSYTMDYGGTILNLECSDKQIKEIKYKTVRFSRTILQLLDGIGGITTYTGTIIPLTIDSKIFDKVKEWLIRHENDVESIDDDEDTQWDKIFISVQKRLVFDLMLAANYLNITKLLNLTCKEIANRIKGKTPEEIRNIFNYNVDDEVED